MKVYAWAVALLAGAGTYAQNLVPNGSFEIADTCWPFLGFFYPTDGPIGWFSSGGTPDYFQSCHSYGHDAGVPLNIMGFQTPQDGNAYGGVITYFVAVPWREYLTVELAAPLSVGQTYYASFYVNAAWGGTEADPQAWLASNRVGMLFTTGAPEQWESGDPVPVPANYAQLYYPWIVTDTVVWTLVSGSFLADSAYQYLTIGNHFDYAITDTLAIGSSINPPMAYMFIDNVCVSASLGDCAMSTGADHIAAESLDVIPNPARDEVVIRRLEKGARILIFDALGRRMWEQRTTGEALRIQVRSWERGSYLLRVEQGGTLRSFQFVLVE